MEEAALTREGNTRAYFIRTRIGVVYAIRSLSEWEILLEWMMAENREARHRKQHESENLEKKTGIERVHLKP